MKVKLTTPEIPRNAALRRMGVIADDAIT